MPHHISAGISGSQAAGAETYGLVPTLDFSSAPPLSDEAPRLQSVDVFVYTWTGAARRR